MVAMNDAGKGSVGRPFSISDSEFASNYERTFPNRPTKNKDVASNRDNNPFPISKESIISSNKGENDIQPIPLSVTDAEYIELQKEIQARLIRALNVPKRYLNIPIS